MMRKFWRGLLRWLPTLLFILAGGWILVMLARFWQDKAKKDGTKKRPENKGPADYARDILDEASDLVESIIGAVSAAKKGGR